MPDGDKNSDKLGTIVGSATKGDEARTLLRVGEEKARPGAAGVPNGRAIGKEDKRTRGNQRHLVAEFEDPIDRVVRWGFRLADGSFREEKGKDGGRRLEG